MTCQVNFVQQFFGCNTCYPDLCALLLVAHLKYPDDQHHGLRLKRGWQELSMDLVGAVNSTKNHQKTEEQTTTIVMSNGLVHARLVHQDDDDDTEGGGIAIPVNGAAMEEKQQKVKMHGLGCSRLQLFLYLWRSCGLLRDFRIFI